MGGDIEIGFTRKNLVRTSGERGDCQERKDREQGPQPGKDGRTYHGHGGREERKWPIFGPPAGQQDDNGNWLRMK
jgi:hypothetical protein